MTVLLPSKKSKRGSVVENRTLTALEGTNQELFLDEVPLNRESVFLTLPNGTSQRLGADYDVDGDRVYWGGLALETILEENDNVTIIYSVV